MYIDPWSRALITDESVTNDYMEPYPGELPASQVSLDEMNTAFLVTPESSQTD